MLHHFYQYCLQLPVYTKSRHYSAKNKIVGPPSGRENLPTRLTTSTNNPDQAIQPQNHPQWHMIEQSGGNYRNKIIE